MPLILFLVSCSLRTMNGLPYSSKAKLINLKIFKIKSRIKIISVNIHFLGGYNQKFQCRVYKACLPSIGWEFWSLHRLGFEADGSSHRTKSYVMYCLSVKFFGWCSKVRLIKGVDLHLGHYLLIIGKIIGCWKLSTLELNKTSFTSSKERPCPNRRSRCYPLWLG